MGSQSAGPSQELGGCQIVISDEIPLFQFALLKKDHKLLQNHCKLELLNQTYTFFVNGLLL